MSDIQSGTLSIRGRAYRPLHATYMADLWAAQNPLLQRGEIGIEQDTDKFKIGNGVDRWNDLEYSSGPQGPQGDTGPYFTPSVNADGDISWTNNGGLPNPQTVNIKGPQGPQGPLGTNAPIVTTISAASTDLEVCSARCVYNTVGIIENALSIINTGSGV